MPVSENVQRFFAFAHHFHYFQRHHGIPNYLVILYTQEFKVKCTKDW